LRLLLRLLLRQRLLLLLEQHHPFRRIKKVRRRGRVLRRERAGEYDGDEVVLRYVAVERGGGEFGEFELSVIRYM
jgi:hypothetical protein